MMNHYETLALKTSASNEDIQNAYLKLSKKFSPENNEDNFYQSLFKQIQEAYETLSDENKKKEYDKSRNLNQPPPPPGSFDSSPRVIFFRSDKEDFEEGEKIHLQWETQNADEVILKPFGPVASRGTKVFKLKNYSKSELTFAIRATNSTSKETVTEVLKLKNRITEIDFSEFEEEKPVEVELVERSRQNPQIKESPQQEEAPLKVDFEEAQPEIARCEEPIQREEPAITANSFAGTATIASATDYSENLLSSRGRLRRSTYFLRCLVIYAFAFFLSSITTETSYYDDGSMVMFFLSFLFLVIMGGIQTIKRCHDLNHSGWLVLFYLIPLVNLGLGLYLLFGEGTRGENRFGPDPKKART